MTRAGGHTAATGRRVLRVALFHLLLAAAAPPAQAAGDITDWLMRVEMATDKVSYTGSFIFEHDGQMETMRVAHRARADGFRQRLFSLTGSPREVIRDNESVWCFLPDKKIGVHEYRQSSRNSFLELRGEQIASLDGYYEFALDGTERIADREAQVIRVMPRDAYRYGYTLWADTETALLLRTDLVDESGTIVERYMFVDIDIGVPIADHELQPRTDRDSLQWFGIDEPGEDRDEADRPMQWDSKSLPPGFMLSHSINRRGPMDEEIVEHHVYSDGLSSVSLFVKQARDDSGAVGFSRMGAVSAYVRRVDGHVITVVGEVPERTVTMIAEGVTRTRQP